MAAFGNSVFMTCVIFARKLSDITGDMGNVGASEETFSGATTNFLFISTNYIAENNFHTRI